MHADASLFGRHVKDALMEVYMEEPSGVPELEEMKQIYAAVQLVFAGLYLAQTLEFLLTEAA